ncbi:hypothetical protein L596_027610 [Steinernema carpocapsae]|uniref:Pepsin inhibitor-3-like repeated domain-containing protein n=1 Tax=Steinernema carpocapsae TaxID=34508 RepID=A0A4U5LW18_STECR|nr:hypothetical protein L596_027610 [Steinernema carpocapsae]
MQLSAFVLFAFCFGVSLSKDFQNPPPWKRYMGPGPVVFPHRTFNVGDCVVVDGMITEKNGESRQLTSSEQQQINQYRMAVGQWSYQLQSRISSQIPMQGRDSKLQVPEFPKAPCICASGCSDQ